MKTLKEFLAESNPRIPRKKGQPAKSKKHSDLYTDEDPKGTIPWFQGCRNCESICFKDT